MLARDLSIYRTTSAQLRSVATGALLCALCAASLGCAFAAFSSSDDPASTPAQPVVIPVANLPVAQPLAGMAEPFRCASAAGTRGRRGAHGKCRVADLPPA